MRRATFTAALCAALLLVAGCKGDPKSPEYWQKSISGGKQAKDRIRSVDDLRASGNLNPSFLPTLHGLLKSEKKLEVKSALARAIGDMKDPSSVEPLAAEIDLGNTDSDGNALNKELASALAKIGDPKGGALMLKLIRAKDSYVKIEAINALGSLKAKEAIDPLVAVATSESEEPFICKKAIQALGDIGDPKAVEPLVKMMFKERKGISFYLEASYSLYQIGQPAADALLPVIKGDDKAILQWAQDNNVKEPALYAKAAQVIGDLADPRAVPALEQKLGYESTFVDIQLFVRMKAAGALGRLRSTGSASKIAGMLTEEEANARAEYIRALVKLGGRDGIASLQKSASTGSWDAREPSIIGVAMLGDERELPFFEKLAKDEEKLTAAECKENSEYAGCNDVPALTKKHVDAINAHAKRVNAAKECKDAACWVKKLDDTDAGVRERAALEVGRSKKAELVTELTKRLTENNLETRLAIIQGVDWMVSDSKEAAKKAAEGLPVLDKQIADERGKTQFVKVNEDLRRLAVKIRRVNL